LGDGQVLELFLFSVTLYKYLSDITRQNLIIRNYGCTCIILMIFIFGYLQSEDILADLAGVKKCLDCFFLQQPVC